MNVNQGVALGTLASGQINAQRVADYAQMQPPKAVSPFDTISGTADVVDLAQARIAALADRLVGPRPTAAGTDAKLGIVPSGLIGDLSSTNTRIRSALDGINADLERIERALP